MPNYTASVAVWEDLPCGLLSFDQEARPAVPLPPSASIPCRADAWQEVSSILPPACPADSPVGGAQHPSRG